MRMGRLSSIILATLIVGAALAYYFYQSTPLKLTKTPVYVSVSPVFQKDSDVEIEVIGTIQPYMTINVRTLVDGQLQYVGFKEGDLVEKDQILFKIDPRPFQIELQQAEATLARDEANLANAIKMLERGQSLKRDKHFSEQELEQLETNVVILKSTIELDKSAIAAAKLKLDYCFIKSPVTGYTGQLQFNIGNIIQAKDSRPLVIINQVIPIYASFSLPEQYLSYLKENNQKGLTELSLRHSRNDKNTPLIKGNISFINNTVDASSGTIQLKATIPNENKVLWPGQFVEVKILLYKIKQAKLIPTVAIQGGAEGFYVYVVNSNNVVEPRPIKVGPIINNYTVVLEGLHSNELVVTEGHLKLTKGSIVRFDRNAQSKEQP